MIPKEVIEDIKSKARIEDVIGSYIQIQKQGANYIAYCPFHEDHDPSLHINTSKQIFKCFSCPSENKSSGDVFSFVMKYKKISYPEAIKEVASQVGYEYDFDQGYKKSFEETIYHKIIADSVAYCQNELNTTIGKTYKDYLLNRHLDKDIIKKYAIGYNPTCDKLYNYLHQKGYEDKDIIAANVCRITNNGIQDVFYDRITIPIYDSNDHPVGFTARSIDKNNTSKYINSTDTPIFHKSNVLFNLNNAKESIKENKQVILAEGPMDVIAFDRAGISNAVCSLGTNLTEKQLSILSKYSNNILLAYDGDKAGQSAILRAGQMAKKLGFEVTIINNKTSLDPDEIINEYGADKLKEMLSRPLHWLDFILLYYQGKYDLNNYSEKKDYVNKVLVEINSCKDELDKETYLKRLSEISGFSYEVLRSKITQKNNGDEPSRDEKVVKRSLGMNHPENKKVSGDETEPKRKTTKEDSGVLAGIVDSIRNVTVNDEKRTVITLTNGRWKYDLWTKNQEYVEKMKIETGTEIAAVISNYSKEKKSATLQYFNYQNTLFSKDNDDGSETTYLLAKSYNPKKLSEKLYVSTVLVKKWNAETKQVDKIWLQLKFVKDLKDVAFENDDAYLYKIGNIIENKVGDKTYYSAFVKDSKRIYNVKKNERDLKNDLTTNL